MKNPPAVGEETRLSLIERLRAFALECDDCGGSLRGEAANLREAADALETHRLMLLSAREEIAWWANEHGCCDGHQDALIDQIDALLPKASSKHARSKP